MITVEPQILANCLVVFLKYKLVKRIAVRKDEPKN